MTANLGTNPLQYQGVSAISPANTFIANRIPNTTDVNYGLGTIWVDQLTNASYILTSFSAGAANWQTVSSTVTPVNVPSGGTGVASFTAHGVVIGEGVGNLAATLAGTNGQVLTGTTGADPSFGALGLRSGLTAHGVLLGEGNNAIVATAVGTDGQVLTGNTGADPTYVALGVRSGLTAHGVLVGEGASAIAAMTVGTNGQILVGATGADPAFATVSSTGTTITSTLGANALNLDVSSALIATVPVTLTSAQIKALAATPITVVANAAAGKSVMFLGAQLKSVYGGTNAFTNPQDLAIRYKDATGAIVSAPITAAGFLDGTANTYQIVGIAATSTIEAAADVEACPLVIHNTGLSEITGNAAGDNTIVVTVKYAILTQ